jgi:sugar lactone lactonase YvrE
VAFCPSSNLVYVVDSGACTVSTITPAGVVTLLAGQAFKPGSANGLGSAASFNFPSGLAVDQSGNVYVADSRNDTIRMITPAGLVSTVAGTPGNAGSANGPGPAASFDLPNGVAVDTTNAIGTIYVADSGNNLIRQITPAGVVSILAGSGSAGSADGTGAAASFWDPTDLALDGSGYLFVVDHANNTIRKINTSTGEVQTVAGVAGPGVGEVVPGALPGSLATPYGIALDSAGHVFITDQNAILEITF